MCRLKISSLEQIVEIIKVLGTPNKQDGQWVEETTTRMCDESEVPEAIRKKISEQEADITDEIEKELKLEV